MPVDFPASDRVYAFFRRWRDRGLVAEFDDRLRDRVRESAGRDREPGLRRREEGERPARGTSSWTPSGCC
ncbi:hypothetical protein [Kitasatospora purpeofusca]|uniref:hypothetical protein n=1 Tax=Kitasatospora purpeofusca TaxID=67352 RepID=UPI003F645FCC